MDEIAKRRERTVVTADDLEPMPSPPGDDSLMPEPHPAPPHSSPTSGYGQVGDLLSSILVINRPVSSAK